MADKSVEIELKSTADTKGAEEMKDALADVKKETKQAGNEAGEGDPQLGKLINIQRAQVASQIAQALGSVTQGLKSMAGGIKDLDKDTEKTFNNIVDGLDAASSAASGAAQGFAVGGPFGAALGALIGLLSVPFKGALNGMIEDLGNAAKAEKAATEAGEKYADFRRKFIAQLLQEKTAAHFRENAEAINAETEAIKNNRAVASAQENLTQGRAARAGATSGEQAVAEVEQAVNDNVTAKQLAEQAVRLAANKVAAAISRGDNEAADAAQEAREVAVGRLKTLLETQAKELTNQAEEASKEVADEAEAEATKLGNDLAANIKETFSKPGVIVDESLRQAQASIAGLLADTKITLDEIPKLQNAIRQMAQSSTSATQETQRLLARTVGVLEGIMGENRALQQRIEQLERKSEALASRTF